MIEGQCHCGAIRWEHAGVPPRATACNCTLCRRAGALWAHDYEGRQIRIIAEETALGAYVQGDRSMAVHFCRHCGNITHWRGLAANGNGQIRIAVNLRMAAPEAVADIPLRRFDGLDRWQALPEDGRCVGEIWF